MLDVSSLIIPSFIAGLLTFLAPCTFPLVPGYLGFISGVKKEEYQTAEGKVRARKAMISNAIAFVLGFSIVFVIFGTVIASLGVAFAPYRGVVTKIAGLIVILFGLFMVGILDLEFLKSEKKMKIPSFIKVGSFSSSLLIGGTFAIGWSPCVGPILAAVLAVAATSSTMGQGAFLLAVFSLGMGLPFLIVAIIFSQVTTYINAISKYLNVISKIGGIFLILIGILLFMDNLTLLISYGYRVMGALGFEGYEQFLIENL